MVQSSVQPTTMKNKEKILKNKEKTSKQTEEQDTTDFLSKKEMIL